MSLPAAFAGSSRAAALGQVAIAPPTFGPNWFATVMGTGIVANAVATLPWQPPALVVASRVVWLLAALLLVVVTVSTVVHHHRQATTVRRYLDDPVLSHFHGAVAMAPLTVGAGALLVGRPVVGTAAAVVIAATLWAVGTLLGLATAVVLPLRLLATHRYRSSEAAGSWLMPVVPPMVSAATGPLLLPYLPTSAARSALLPACLALFVLALGLSLVVFVPLGRRLLRHGVGPAASVPTLLIVLGPLGQSVTAAHTMGEGAGGAGPAAGLAYGLPTWVLTIAWLVIASTITARTARAGMPFSMTWWSFTFPVGTVVTGTSALAAASGSTVLAVTAQVLFTGLVAAWLLVGTRTLIGLRDGSLTRPA